MRNGDPAAAEQLSELIYSSLCRRAHNLLGTERHDAVVTTRGLVNEAYARLAGNLPAIQDRKHLLSLITKKMREILVDWARQRQAACRAGVVRSLDDENMREAEAVGLKGQHCLTLVEILEIDQALSRLAEQHPDWAELLELRYFGGLTVEETAEQMGLSRSVADRTAKRGVAELAKILGRPAGS